MSGAIEITKEAEEILPPEGLKLIKGEGSLITEKIQALSVTSAVKYEEAVYLGTENRKIMTGIENFRKAIVKPLNDQVKVINGLFGNFVKRFEDNEAKLRLQMGKYQDSIKKIEKIQTVNVETGASASIQERWDFEITDETKIDRKYLTVDLVKLGKEVRAGVFPEGNQNGFKVFKKRSVAFKTA